MNLLVGGTGFAFVSAVKGRPTSYPENLLYYGEILSKIVRTILFKPCHSIFYRRVQIHLDFLL